MNFVPQVSRGGSFGGWRYGKLCAQLFNFFEHQDFLLLYFKENQGVTCVPQVSRDSVAGEYMVVMLVVDSHNVVHQ
jgi:hypothetical protein